MTALTPAERAANLARSAAPPLGEGAHYADRTDALGPFRVLCRCEVGTAHDEDGNPQPLVFPDRLDRAYAPNHVKPTIGASDE